MAGAQVPSDRHKEAVRSWTPRVRKALEEDFAAQLDRLGMRADGRHEPIDGMRLPDERKAIRRRVEALLAREVTAEGSAERGFANVLRELTYTLLNRLVGLKAMEARGLLFLPPPGDPGALPESTEVISPVPGQRYSRYLRDFRDAAGQRYKYADDADSALLRDALTAAFRHVTRDIRVLFDPDHECACLWPTHAALVEAIRLINDELPPDACRAPDFLGWVYQFFNRDEKRRIRDENQGTPRSSWELAVINQFYTPAWIVKALVDNTLGRLWLQMHPDSSLRATEPPPLPGEPDRDAPVADYLVPRTGEKIRFQRLTETGEVQTFKRASDITLLDPACGTMHFGQYAFGLFHRMYLDEIEHAGQDGWPAEASVAEAADIPAAIIENNLFGVDIDPRAIQIASLSLLLRAKESALRHGYPPTDVQVKRTNLVVANAVDLGADRLRALVDRLGSRTGSPALRARLFATLWDNLRHVGELGSLAQVREGVTHVLDDWVDAEARSRGITRILQPAHEQQLELGDLLTQAARARAQQLELERAALEEEAAKLRRELLAAVEAAAADIADHPADRLFAEDTARGIKLLQLLSRRYDIAVMNPPYGAFVPRVRAFVKAAYPLTSNDMYGAFIDRACQLTEREGYVGALVSSTFTKLKSFEKLRTEILLKRNPLILMLDLGLDILDDANVSAAAISLRGGPP